MKSNNDLVLKPSVILEIQGTVLEKYFCDIILSRFNNNINDIGYIYNFIIGVSSEEDLFNAFQNEFSNELLVCDSFEHLSGIALQKELVEEFEYLKSCFISLFELQTG